MGNKIKWSREAVLVESKKYSTRAEFQKNSSGAYKAAIRLGILEEARSHMPKNASGPHKWTDDAVRDEALKYKTKAEFQHGSGSAYSAAIKRNLIEEVCKHMPIYTRLGHTNPNFVWADEDLKEESLKYGSKSEFRKKSRGAFEACKRRDILGLVCSHMMPLYKKWTYSALFKEAQKYDYRSEFELNDPAAYSSALVRKIMDKICKHMKRPSQSPQEKELLGRIIAIFPNAKVLRDMKVKIKNKPHIKGFDIDIYVSELTKGIEFDGTYHHSFEGLKRARPNWPDEDIRNYHKLKDKWFKSKGISILHVKQKDWDLDKEACIKRCLDFLKSI